MPYILLIVESPFVYFWKSVSIDVVFARRGSVEVQFTPMCVHANCTPEIFTKSIGSHDIWQWKTWP